MKTFWHFSFDFKAQIRIIPLRGRAVVARRAHNPEVVGSNPTPATTIFIAKSTLNRLGQRFGFFRFEELIRNVFWSSGNGKRGAKKVFPPLLTVWLIQNGIG